MLGTSEDIATTGLGNTCCFTIVDFSVRQGRKHVHSKLLRSAHGFPPWFQNACCINFNSPKLRDGSKPVVRRRAPCNVEGRTQLFSPGQLPRTAGQPLIPQDQGPRAQILSQDPAKPRANKTDKKRGRELL